MNTSPATSVAVVLESAMVQDSVTVADPPVASTVDWLNASVRSDNALVSAAAEIAGNPSAVNSAITETETMAPGRNLIHMLLRGWQSRIRDTLPVRRGSSFS